MLHPRELHENGVPVIRVATSLNLQRLEVEPGRNRSGYQITNPQIPY